MRKAPLFVRTAAFMCTCGPLLIAGARQVRAETPHQSRDGHIGSAGQVDSAGSEDSNTPAPDFAGLLRSDVQLRAWFNADRTRALLRVGAYTSKLYRAWKVALADLDGDGTNEVVLGAWSSMRRHDEPDPHRAVWVLGWDSEKQELHEVWRGSALARPLLDFEMKAGRLIAVERLNGVCFRTRYQWTGFGFAARSVVREECKK